MPSERIQREIDRLLDQAGEALQASDWATVRDRASNVLRFDLENADAKAFLDAADQDPSGTSSSTSNTDSSLASSTPQPTSFADGRYQVTKFLGEGGKKKVYLAHDATLDRDVAFALIKTEGLDEASRTRVSREAQAMGRLGDHPHIVTVYDLGEEGDQPYMVLPVLTGGDGGMETSEHGGHDSGSHGGSESPEHGSHDSGGHEGHGSDHSSMVAVNAQLLRRSEASVTRGSGTA